MTKFVGARFPQPLLDEIDAYARALGERRSLALRTLVRRGLAAAGSDDGGAGPARPASAGAPPGVTP